MATGIETYNAIKAARDSGIRPDFPLNTNDSIDLLKLTSEHLISLGYEEGVAEIVSSELFQGKHDALARTMGLEFVISHDTPSLVDN